MTHLDLFSGIGGFALAAERVWPEIEHTFCEIDPFCQVVLKKHWPNSKIYGDIRTLTNANEPRREGSELLQQGRSSSWRCDLLTGGFPCQPFSQAGQRKGTSDDRHLWPEMRRVIQEFSPRWIVAENVRGLLSIDGGLVFEQVCTDMEALGYSVQPFIIPACAVNAPHRRDRVWFVSHAKHDGLHGSEDGESRDERGNGNTERKDEHGEPTRSVMARKAVTHSSDKGLEGWEPKEGKGLDGQRDRNWSKERANWSEDWPTVATRLCRMDDGLPDGIPRPKGWRNAALKAYGNAIVPTVAEQIFRAIHSLSI